MEEYDLTVLVLVAFLESCKEEHLMYLKNSTYSNINVAKKFGLDEAKIFKKAIKSYRTPNSNPAISNMIVNYFNSK